EVLAPGSSEPDAAIHTPSISCRMSLRAFSAISPGLICWIGAIGELEEALLPLSGRLRRGRHFERVYSVYSWDFEVTWRILWKSLSPVVPNSSAKHAMMKLGRVVEAGDQQPASCQHRNHLLQCSCND